MHVRIADLFFYTLLEGCFYSLTKQGFAPQHVRKLVNSETRGEKLDEETTFTTTAHLLANSLVFSELIKIPKTYTSRQSSFSLVEFFHPSHLFKLSV